MKEEYLKYLVCPLCKGSLQLEKVRDGGGWIRKGILECRPCRQCYEIIHGIPRFVRDRHYSNGFAFEWAKHAKTQYDSYTGTKISETRFFRETRWPMDLIGEVILEVGGGSGRFTEQAAKTGAMIISIDSSHAVEANYASNGEKENVFIVQGDLYEMPFQESSFDRLFCFGVLQHTPDVERAFKTLPNYLKPGGRLVMDVYPKFKGLVGILKSVFTTRYHLRPFTTRMSSMNLYRLCDYYLKLMWPIAKRIGALPSLGRVMNRLFLLPYYGDRHDLSEDLLKEWAILDLFDMLSPAYDSPQTLETIERWFREARLSDVEVHYGYNGIEGRGRRPFVQPDRETGSPHTTSPEAVEIR